MNRECTSKLGFLTYYVIVAVLIEIAMFLQLDIGVLPKYWLYDLSIILMIGGIIFIIPHYSIQAAVTGIMLGVQLLLFYLNFSLYHLYGDVFSFDMINLFKEAAKAVTTDFTFVWLIVALVTAFIFIVGGIIFIANQKKRHKIPFRHNFSIAVVMILIIIQGLSVSMFMSQRQEIKKTASIVNADQISDGFLMDTSLLKIASLKTFGLFGYYANNLFNTVWKKNVDTSTLDSAIMYFSNGEMFDESDSELFGVDQGNNVIMVMMESLEWFAFSDGTYNSHVFSDELTPNIYALIEEGLIASDFFSKSKTNFSEGIGFIGSYPIGKYMEQVTRNSSSTQYGFTLPNMLKNEGYTTRYFHTNESSYYDRAKTHTKLGFDGVYCWDYEEFGYDGGFKWNHWIKEEDLVYSALDYMIPTTSNRIEYGDEAEKFFTFYTTVSSHGPYDNNSYNGDQIEYKDLVLDSEWYQNVLDAYKDEPNETINRLVNYQASIVGLDKAIGVLINRLKEYGIYDNTTIILYSDHNAYYHELSNDIKGVEGGDYMDMDLNTVPLIIKSSGIAAKYLDENGKKIDSTDRFCSAYDLVPTVLDLLGVTYNKRVYIGNSLFTPIEDKYIDIYGQEQEMIVYYSLTGGLISKEVYTLNMTNFKYNNYTSVDCLDQFKKTANETLSKLNYIYLFYVYDLYKYVV